VLKREKKPGDGQGNEPDNRKEAAKLHGTWIVESTARNGISDKGVHGELWVFADGKVAGWDYDAIPYAVDVAKDPFWIDVTGKFTTSRGIYKLDGDKLHLAFSVGRDPNQRPKTFDAEDVFWTTLRRATKDDPRYSRTESARNLKKIGIAIHNYFDNFKRLPPAASSGVNDPTATPFLSWRVAILPYIDQQALYQQFDLDKPWDDPHNMKLIAKMPKLYLVPGVDAKEGMTHYRTLVGPGTLLDPQKGPAGKLIAKYTLGKIPDGPSNVIMVVEAEEPAIWTKPDDLRYDAKGPLPKLGVAPLGFNVLLADSTVRFVGPSVPENVLRPYLTCDNAIPRRSLNLDD
jgi:uncharacterized protein (TIGR03067 family)